MYYPYQWPSPASPQRNWQAELNSLLFSNIFLFYFPSLVNYEFACGTAGPTYASRRGRRLPADQFHAALLAVTLVPATLMAVVLPVFSANFHFSNVRGSYVSSAMNAEPSGMSIVPYVTRRPMTMLQYLWANIGIVLLQVAFCLPAFLFLSSLGLASKSPVVSNG